MKKFLKILLWIGLVLVLTVVVLIGYVQFFWNKTFDAPYPDITATDDPVMIERGKYLVYGVSHCAVCHVPNDKVMEVDRGLEIPLSGGWEEEIPGFGTFRGRNLTPDPETGIGKLTDAQIARAIRYGVKHDGKMLPPLMMFQEMTDEDLTAVISFLRSQEPVYNKVETSEYSFIIKALTAFGIFKPEGPKKTPAKFLARDTTAVYGEYLAKNMGNCVGCHVKMGKDGKPVTPAFSGGGIFPPGPFSEGYGYVSPNLTPHKGTGVIAHWSEEAFVHRFKSGRIHKGSPMPWGCYSRMDEADMKAVYQYLHSLEPVEIAISKTVYAPGEVLPE